MSFAAVLQRARKLENPYPGLRPFETHEAHLFFGRERQVGEILARLERDRFVAVVGVSGSGKSSLVKAGLIPALERGSVQDAAAQWRTVVIRPAGNPFESLRACLEQQGLDSSGLRRTSRALTDVARQLEGRETLLLVVDQFEELFRYKDARTHTADRRQEREAAAGDAADFVQLLLAAARSEPPVYIVLTMRSDYLGDCAEFRDLPEALNDCQYLIPRLTREQRRMSIIGPLGRTGIAANLVQRMLNDAGDEPDQLPILQHALMRTWAHWRRSDPEGARKIEIEDYEAIGGFDEALDQHAGELLTGMPESTVATIFKRLTARGRGNRERRDPATLAELWAVCGAVTAEQKDAVEAIINHFRTGEATFLTPRDGALTADKYIDITHESLIREWHKLRSEWLPEEAKSAQTFADLIVGARTWKDGRGELLRGLDLRDALDWRARRNQTEAWAAHYASEQDLALVLEFLAAGEAEERARRFRAKRNLVLTAAAAILFAALAVFGFVQWSAAAKERRQAEFERMSADAARSVAHGQAGEAQRSQAKAQAAEIAARKDFERAVAAEKDAVEQKNAAVRARDEAQRSEAKAQAAENAARKDFERAVAAEKDAVQQKNAAVRARDETLRRERGLDLETRGWGVFIADETPADVREALKPLLEKRKSQTGGLYKEFRWRANTKTAASALDRYGIEAGPFGGVPFYLLLVGSPKQIPFEAQYELAAQHAVGRLYFPTSEGYRTYVTNLLAAEAEPRPRVSSAVLVGPTHRGDASTTMMTNQLMKPLSMSLAKEPEFQRYEWGVEAVLGDSATKERIKRTLNSANPPSLFVFGGHGMEWPLTDADAQLHNQGALICSGWESGKQVGPDHTFTERDLAAHANFRGTVMVFLTAFSAGTPATDTFRTNSDGSAIPIAPEPFLSAMATRLLSNASGSSLAVVGHVDRMWSWSFQTTTGLPAPGMFSSALKHLANGGTVGMAMDSFRLRSAQLATRLALNANAAPAPLANLRIAATDTRQYIVLGDPAAAIKVRPKD